MEGEKYIDYPSVFCFAKSTSPDKGRHCRCASHGYKLTIPPSFASQNPPPFRAREAWTGGLGCRLGRCFCSAEVSTGHPHPVPYAKHYLHIVGNNLCVVRLVILTDRQGCRSLHKTILKYRRDRPPGRSVLYFIKRVGEKTDCFVVKTKKKQHKFRFFTDFG